MVAVCLFYLLFAVLNYDLAMMWGATHGFNGVIEVLVAAVEPLEPFQCYEGIRPTMLNRILMSFLLFTIAPVFFPLLFLLHRERATAFIYRCWDLLHPVKESYWKFRWK
jgi:hypothetical protein